MGLSAGKFKPNYGNQNGDTLDLQSLLGGLAIGGKSQMGGGSIMSESQGNMRSGMQFND